MDEKQLLELWKQQNVNEVAYLDLHFKYANWYSAFFVALSTAYIVGFSQYYRNVASILFLALPLLIIALAHLGKKAVDRFYLSLLETVTNLAKLEELLGIAGAIWTKSYAKSTRVLWPEDKQFMPLRHFKARYSTEITSSEQFIKEHMKRGASKTTHDTFLAFQIVAALLLIGGIVVYILVRTCQL